MRQVYFILILILFNLPSISTSANPFIDIINKSCLQLPTSAVDTEFSRLLNQIQNDFKDQDTRIKNPHEFVAALDEVISHSEFAYLLKCRNAIAQHGYTYHLNFQNPSDGDQSMSVLTNGQNVTLNFNLTKSVQRVLFVYLHEMTHVCQTAERENSESIGDYVRFSLFGEVEAFYNMQLAYRKFVSISPTLCMAHGTSSDSSKGNLNEAYLDAERKIEQGIFAQSIVSGYMESYKNYEHELVDMNSPLLTYSDPVTKATFTLRSLDIRLANLIKRISIQ